MGTRRLKKSLKKVDHVWELCVDTPRKSCASLGTGGTSHERSWQMQGGCVCVCVCLCVLSELFADTFECQEGSYHRVKQHHASM